MPIDHSNPPRFLTLDDVAEILSTSHSQVYAMVRRGELAAIRIGGRQQWRVEASALEAYIQQKYVETKEYVDTTPFEPVGSSTEED